MNAVAEAKTGEVVTWDDRAAPPVTPLTPMDMLNKAVASGASVEIIEKMMALYERWDASQARKAFDEAMANAKAEIPTIAKNRQVGFESKRAGAAATSYRHEDLAEIARTVDPILSKYGLSYRWRTKSEINQPIAVTCVVSHRNGHFEENTLLAGRDDSGNKNSIQAVGSTITYLQRYTLKAALGLAASNDDDAKASGDGVEKISERQIDDLQALLQECKVNLASVLRVFQIESLADLPASKYNEAVSKIEAKGSPRQ